MASSIAAPSIGIIICSSRQPRVCPQIAAYVTETIQSRANDAPASSLHPDAAPPPGAAAAAANLHLIDLAAWNLPFFDEPLIPSQITDPSHYTHAHTRAWSAEIQRHGAFIFVLPQYNWGYPAVVKNCIDFLFREWNGKSAMIVSYGGHGGGKGGSQLRQVLQGVRMNVAETMPALAFPSREIVGRASRGEEVPVLGEGGMWDVEREVVRKAFDEMVALAVMK
ncbi:flavoprotein-like protein [Usnea florida]